MSELAVRRAARPESLLQNWLPGLLILLVGLGSGALGCVRRPGYERDDVARTQSVSASATSERFSGPGDSASQRPTRQPSIESSIQSWSPPSGLFAVVFAPHPDDETLAAAGLIQLVLQEGGQVRVVFLTDGDGYPDGVRRWRGRDHVDANDFVAYGTARREEALLALGHLGLQVKDVFFLGFPDDGLHILWTAAHWRKGHPWRSPHTGWLRPPSRDPILSGLSYSGQELEIALGRLLRKWKPQCVVLPDPRDRHPDHCAAGVFVLDVLRSLSAGGSWRPQVLSYLVHSPDYPGDPSWFATVTGSGVCGSETAQEVLAQTRWLRVMIPGPLLQRKREATAEYRTQGQVMGELLLQFVRTVEWFASWGETQIETVPAAYARKMGRNSSHRTPRLFALRAHGRE